MAAHRKTLGVRIVSFVQIKGEGWIDKGELWAIFGSHKNLVESSITAGKPAISLPK